MNALTVLGSVANVAELSHLAAMEQLPNIPIDWPVGQRVYMGDASEPPPTFRAGVSAFNPWWLVLAIVLVVAVTGKRR